MSLLTTINGGNNTSPYYVENVGTDINPIIPSPSLSILGDSLGNAYVNAANPTIGSLHLGANFTVPNSIVCSSGPALNSMNVPTVFNAGAIFTASVDLTATAPTLKSATQVVGALPSGGAGTAIPQPALSAGTYIVHFQAAPADIDYAVSVIGYWNGTSWSAGGGMASAALGVSGSQILVSPSAGTNLTYYHNKGSDVSMPFVYFLQVSTNA